MTETKQSPWSSFAEAKDAYDRIEPMTTELAALRKLGFDPDEADNVRILSYLDVQQRFLTNPSVQLADLDPNVRDCLAAHAACRGLEVSPESLDSQRVGNVLLDVFDFRREVIKTGWSFSALILLRDDLVIYKTWGGSPHVRTQERRTKPLGPLQELGGFAADRAQAAL